MANHHLFCRGVRSFPQAERGCDGSAQQLWVGQRRERNERHASREIVDHLRGGLQAQPCLTTAARSRQRHRPHVLAREQIDDTGQLGVPAEEGSRLHRKVRLIEALEWRKLFLTELEDPLGRLKVLQSMRPEILHVGIDQLARRFGQQDLAAVSSRGDARALVHVEADVAFFGQERLAGVKTHPDADGS